MPLAEGQRAPRAVAVALPLNTAAFLLLEVGLSRILAVAQWYHLAFMVLSIALLGGGLGPLLLTRRALTPERAAAWLRGALLALPPVGFASFWAFDRLPFEPLELGADPAQWALVPLGCALLALPFLLSGLATALCFTIAPARSARLYFLDLAGAAAGALAFLWTLGAVGAWGTVFAACLLWALAALAVALGAPRRRQELGAAAGALVALVAFGLVLLAPQLEVRISRTKLIGAEPAARVLASPLHVLTAESTVGRVDVVRTRQGHVAVLDGGTAATLLVSPKVARQRQVDLQAVLRAVRPERVLVLGSGGGTEVRLALDAGAQEVVAVELNPVINELVTGRFARTLGNVFADPRVTLHTDEARSFLMRSQERFDAILLVHTISNAALMAGGLSLAENYALTREAFETYHDHLTERGVLFFTRPSFQLARLARTAEAAWGARGVEAFAPHAMAWIPRDPGRALYRFYGALLVGRSALPAALRTGIQPALARVALRERPLDTLEAGGLTEPSTDDRPFFNQRVGFADLTGEHVAAVFEGDARLALEDRPVAEVTLVLLLGQLVVLGAALFMLPLLLARRRERRDARRGASVVAAGAYFFLLGLAFLLVEVAFIQQLTLYLGQPAVAFSLVLAGLLVFAGLGSATDRGWRPGAGERSWALGLPALLVATALVASPLMGLTLGAPFGLRVAAAIALMAPSAFLMGRPFSRGLRWAGEAPERIGWAFGLNGLASVMASLLALMLAMVLGLRAVVLIGAALYLVAGWLFQRLTARSDRVET